MASKTTVMLLDDVDGSDAAETVRFGIDGVEYEIDLSDDNAQKLREAIGQYIDHGRRIGSRRGAQVAAAGSGYSRRSSSGGGGKKRGSYTVEERRAMQKFAEEHGLPVPGDRGRIASKVIDAWESAGQPT